MDDAVLVASRVMTDLGFKFEGRTAEILPGNLLALRN